MQLLCGQGHELQGGETAVTDRAESERGREREREGGGKWSQAPPVIVKEKATVITKGECMCIMYHKTINIYHLAYKSLTYMYIHIDVYTCRGNHNGL